MAPHRPPSAVCVCVCMCVMLAGAVGAVRAAGSSKAATKPHIVMILVDDWGYDDIGFRRNDSEIETPNLNAMVKDGILLEQAYSFYWCTPSRSSLLSGRLPLHAFQTNQHLSVSIWDKKDPRTAGTGIPQGMTTMPRYLKEAGYATHAVGKWDAGIATPDHTPEGRGFDTSLIYYNHDNDAFQYNISDTVIFSHPIECNVLKYGRRGFLDSWSNGGPNGDLQLGHYEEWMFRDHILDTIAAHNASQPLFLYYASRIAHAPLQVPWEYLERAAAIDNPTRQHYHAMVNALDDVVGNITGALRTHGLYDNTLIVVQSDNGGPIYLCNGLNGSICGGANNHPMRGGKLTPWQGGIRVTSFVTGGFVPEAQRGTTRHGMLLLADWMATFCALAGTDCSHDPVAAQHSLPQPDGLNMVPLLLGTNLTSPRTEYPITTPGMELLIRWPYKVIKGHAPMAVWTGPRFPNNTSPNGGTGFALAVGIDCKPGCLFNIETDPNEHTDLAPTQPALLASMLARLAVWENATLQRNFGDLDAAACHAYIDEYHGFFGPFIGA